jgi:signal transduction histidine kinase
MLVVRGGGLLVVVVTAGGTVWEGFLSGGPLHRAVAAVLGLAALALLGLRNRHPTGVLAATLALAGVVGVLVGSTPLATTVTLAVVFALYSVGTRSDTGRGLVASACSWLLLVVTQLIGHRGSGVIGGHLVLIAAVTATYLYVRSYRALIDSYRERAEQAEREQGWQTNRAVGAERVRIARELHDVVAHHVSLLVVQAGAVRETLPVEHPTRPVLDSMIDGGRHAMSELRDMLDALRFDGTTGGIPDPSGSGPPAPRAPLPEVEQVADLVAGARTAGMDVALAVAGGPVTLPPTLSLAAYRIVQESLTNVVKHAPASVVRVRLGYAARSFEVEVVNTPQSIAGLPRYPEVQEGDTRGRHGINGMRERAALANGELTAGPSPEGWKVLARFPLDPAPPVPGLRATVG